ncbi:RsiV family protein [Nocardia sp. NPDC051030]|uniref:RsiV family protein n=1 Tax=Nocardia sp. NPDC051030 TaxID=3155162 RepID=UPI00342F1859
MRIRIAAAIAALSVGLTACQGQQSPPSMPKTLNTTTEQPTTVQPTTENPQTSDAIPPSNALSTSQTRVNGKQGTVNYDVTLPQVLGGNGSAATAFNDGMRALLQKRIDTYSTAVSITDSSKLSKVEHIGTHVVSGFLWLSIDGGGAHPWTELATYVINIDTKKEITLADLFNDQQAGLDALSVQAAKLLPATKTGDSYDRKGITATVEHFQTWTATPSGMHVYFQMGQVGPAAMGPVDITIPWDDLINVLKPGRVALMSS